MNTKYFNMKNLAIIAMVALPFMSFATGTAAEVGSTISFLDKVVALLSGGIARTLATIAVIILGLAAMFGFFDMRKAGMIILGIILVFSASWIVTQIAPEPTTTTSIETVITNPNV